MQNDPPHAPLRVLVVEDHADTRRTLEMLLVSWGHEAREAADGPEALRVAKEFRPDLVLLDLAIPGLDGLEVARRLRQDGASPSLVALTGLAERRFEAIARAAGIDRFLVKPCPPDVIRSLVEDFAASPGRPLSERPPPPESADLLGG